MMLLRSFLLQIFAVVCFMGNTGTTTMAQFLDFTFDECPMQTFTCCEEDCCGPNTEWTSSECVASQGAPGWTGVYSAEYRFGCQEVRECCEEGCCGEGAIFSSDIACCIAVPDSTTEFPPPLDPPPEEVIAADAAAGGVPLGHCCTRANCNGPLLGQISQESCRVIVEGKSWCSGGLKPITFLGIRIGMECPEGKCVMPP